MLLTTRRPRIVLVGDLLADVWWSAGPSSHNIEHAAMALVSEPGSCKITAGGVGIVADAFSRAGADVCLFSVIGPQAEAALASRALQKVGVNIGGVVYDDNFTTPVKTRYVNPNGHILLRHDVEAPAKPHAGFDLDLLENLIKLGDIVIVSDYAKGCITPNNRKKLLELCWDYKKPIFVDTKPALVEHYSGVTGFKLNQIETEAVAGVAHKPGLALETVSAARRNLGCYLLVTTAGHCGAIWATPAQTNCVMSPRRYSSGNCVGAGDVFFVGFTLGLLQYDEDFRKLHPEYIDAAVFSGIIAAGQRVRTNGTKPFSYEAVQKEIAQYEARFNPIRKIHSLDVFCRLANQRRAAGKRVVFTNGCYDLLHSGHISTLAYSRKQGDALFVAINSDASVRKLKGETRPVQDEMTRATNLSALECVDAVCIFDDTEPLTSLRELIHNVRPAVLTKGPDYADKEIVGAEFADSVILCPLVPEQSTTAFVNKLKAVK